MTRACVVPPAVAAAIAAIRELSLPSREYEETLRRQKAEYAKAHAEHDAQGRIVQRWINRRFRAALGPRYCIDADRSRGYLLDWSYVAGKSRHRVPVRPYVHVTIYLPHGRECGAPSARSKLSEHGDGRCTVQCTYFPHTGQDLAQWADQWIGWLKAAPAPARPASLQVCP